MKRFLKTMALAVLILMPALVTAQIKVSPVAGYDFQFRYSSTEKVASLFNGVTAGAQANLPTSRFFSFTGGLQYHFAFTNSTVAYCNLQKGDAAIYEHSLELPVTFGVRLPLKNGHALLIDLGPEGSFNAFSSLKPKKNVLGYNADESYDLMKKGMAQRWNVFGCGTLGYEFADFLTFKAGYRFGFLNQGSETNTIKVHSITAAFILKF